MPENRELRGGRRVQLAVTIVPGTQRSSAPLFLIAGGPGQSAVEQGRALLSTLRSIHTGDLVLVDQRGTGSSNPLTCEGGFSILRRRADAEVTACLESLRSRADLLRYGTREAVEDLEAIRRALRYQRINLFGISYGTRVATNYMRRYPQWVRAALLRATAPPDFNIVYEGTLNADEELGRVFSDCRSDADCSTDFPQLEAKLAAIRGRLERDPAPIRAPGAPGREQTILVTPQLFNSTFYVLLLSAETRQRIPRLIAQIDADGFQPIAPIIAQIREAVYGTIPVGMYLSVVCSEDLPRIPVVEAFRPRLGFGAEIATIARICARWPHRKLPSSFFAPLRVSTPTLLLSGAVDPSTTAQAASRLASTLPNASHIILPATAHAPPVPECALEATAAFLRSASVVGPPPDCSELTLRSFARAPGR